MKEPNSLSRVAAFHKKFGQPIKSGPEILDSNRSELRLNLLKEELMELEDAIAKKNIVKIADAFCDLQYVLSGAILEFGLGDKFAELFEEVHKSNMSKLCKSKDEAVKTRNYYHDEGQEADIIKIEEYYLVVRKSDKKVLKSINYSEARLKEILEK